MPGWKGTNLKEFEKDLLLRMIWACFGLDEVMQGRKKVEGKGREREEKWRERKERKGRKI